MISYSEGRKMVALSVAQFPDTFGLCAHPGVFRVNQAACYYNDRAVQIVIQVQDGERWVDFCREDFDVALKQIVPLVKDTPDAYTCPECFGGVVDGRCCDCGWEDRSEPEPKRPTFREYGRIEIPDVGAPVLAPQSDALGWHDDSWHNDAAACLSYRSDCDTFPQLMLWVDYVNPRNRECEGARFILIERTGHESVKDTVLYEGESETDAVAHARAWLAMR
jgi:hypothetical protein